MPIRINLLAEAQALEDLRRRDPVKRTVIVGIGLVSFMVLWSVSLWVKSIAYKTEISNAQELLKTYSTANKEVLNNIKQTKEISQKLDALQKLSHDRFRAGNLMDGLQHITVEDVQLLHVRYDDRLNFNEEIRPDEETHRKARAAFVTDRVTVTLDAKDSSAHPGDLIPKFQQAVTDSPYFTAMLDKSDPQRVHLKPGSVGLQQMGADGRSFQAFGLECLYPEKTR